MFCAGGLVNMSSNIFEYLRSSYLTIDSTLILDPEHWNMLRPYGLRNGKRVPLTLIGTIVWTLGAIVRYAFFIPLRLALCFFSIHYLVLQMILVLHLLPLKIQPPVYKAVFPSVFLSLANGPGGYLRVHNTHFLPEGN